MKTFMLVILLALLLSACMPALEQGNCQELDACVAIAELGTYVCDIYTVSGMHCVIAVKTGYGGGGIDCDWK